MTTNDSLSAVPLAEAAALLGRDAATIEPLIAAAVHAAETPTADRCVLPGPAVEVEFDLDGRRYRAVRESARTEEWHLLLPR